jgi:hypothetical protein
MKKRVIILSIIILIFGIIIIFNFNNLSSLITHRIDQNDIIRNFNGNITIFTNTSKFLADYSDDITIDNKSKEKNRYILDILPSGGLIEEEYVNVDLVNKNFNTIFNKLHYSCIRKDSNAIYYIRNSDFSYEQGIIYSLDGKAPNPNQVRIKKITNLKDGWYYYEGE